MKSRKTTVVESSKSRGTFVVCGGTVTCSSACCPVASALGVIEGGFQGICAGRGTDKDGQLVVIGEVFARTPRAGGIGVEDGLTVSY